MRNLSEILPDYMHLYFDGEAGDGAGDGNGTTGGDTGSDGAGNTETTDDKLPKTQEELEALIKSRLSREQKRLEASAKKKSEAARLSSMNEQERAKHEAETLRQEVEELKRERDRAKMATAAREILQADKVNVPDSVVEALISDDADETNDRVKSFSKAFKSAVQAAVKEALAHKEKTGGSSGGLTKADIMKEQNPQKRQDLIRQNMSLFKHK